MVVVVFVVVVVVVVVVVSLERWRNRRRVMPKVGEIVVLAAACAHDDTACVRILTKSGIILWHGRILYIVMGSSFTEGTS